MYFCHTSHESNCKHNYNISTYSKYGIITVYYSDKMDPNVATHTRMYDTLVLIFP